MKRFNIFYLFYFIIFIITFIFSKNNIKFSIILFSIFCIFFLLNSNVNNKSFKENDAVEMGKRITDFVLKIIPCNCNISIRRRHLKDLFFDCNNKKTALVTFGLCVPLEPEIIIYAETIFICSHKHKILFIFKFIKVLLHEIRHSQQVGSDKEIFKNSIKANEDYILYKKQFIEQDADNFAKKVIIKNFFKILVFIFKFKNNPL